MSSDKGLKVSLNLLISVVLSVAPKYCGADTLFPTIAESCQWVEFKAEGFREPVCGVIYRLEDTVTNGMALGGIDTGCIDIETSGLLGYCTIFNTHVPRRGLINLPFLGMNIGGNTWVLCSNSPKDAYGEFQKDSKFVPEHLQKVFMDLKLDGVRTAKQIHYWGHYPVADIEYETDAPVSVGLRAWASFFPGDTTQSMLPGIVFEVHLRNDEASAQEGTLAFSFPGPTLREAGCEVFRHNKANKDGFAGIGVDAPLASYVIGVIGKREVRTGGELGADGNAWAAINQILPKLSVNQPGTSIAVDFKLNPGQKDTVRFLLTWFAPTFNSAGYNGAETIHTAWGHQPNGGVEIYTHRYAKHYPDAVQTAGLLAQKHASLLRRILAWQQEIYTDKELPLWLKDSLVNNLYLITEDSLWVEAKPPLGDWVKPEDGLFGMNECPRGCPQIECIPCSFYGNQPIIYFFPDAALSTLRGYKAYMNENGDAPFIFGGSTGSTGYIDFTSPTWGYQKVTNGISLAAIVDRFLRCHDTPDRKYLKEFYPIIKKNTIFTVHLRTTPEYSFGERIISMPDGENEKEWFEADDPGFRGMTSHVGGLHLAQLRIAERMANDVGDTEFAAQCAEWIKAGAEAMEKRLWDTRGFYLNFFEPETNTKSDWVFGYQLDGEWVIAHQGLEGVLLQDRVAMTLDTIKRCNVIPSKFGMFQYAAPDGSPRPPAKSGAWDYGRFSYHPPDTLMLAMTYMYHGRKEFGIELARKVWHNFICLKGYTWELPVHMRGDLDTGERGFGTDYYQNMMLWSLPAAIAESSFEAPLRDGGLVARIIAAAKGK